jgi:hypothetical protein
MQTINYIDVSSSKTKIKNEYDIHFQFIKISLFSFFFLLKLFKTKNYINYNIHANKYVNFFFSWKNLSFHLNQRNSKKKYWTNFLAKSRREIEQNTNFLIQYFGWSTKIKKILCNTSFLMFLLMSSYSFGSNRQKKQPSFSRNYLITNLTACSWRHKKVRFYW